MARIEPFERHSREYDKWFDRNREIYLAELNVIKNLIPTGRFGVEIGIGTGRFAVPLKIKVGIDPSRKMTEISREKGVQVCRAVAENLPFKDKSFDFALMITTICFVDDLPMSLREVYRVLKPQGFIIVGFVDRESELGIRYQLKREKSKFYKSATFYSTEEVMDLLSRYGFKISMIKQTVFLQSSEINHVERGYGRGSFVVIRADKAFSEGEWQ
ncbi:SAM-dependent methyltransferase [Euryarchaeota archaeon ex4484_162]|nr:MAG: SAM-dependent methyltransferase [Euryarchaeota archaeon ex4484_162]RLB81006.1 MAG: SAM-dependent methyltransferase [Deltaproteobacteria bacterium]RLF28079.1 MAG: SAM-dependent methyltransferase [Thermoplasmata archaeon]